MSHSVRITEQLFEETSPERVDRDQRVIRGVRVLGLKSKNTGRSIGLESDRPYSYKPEAVEEALPMYEGAIVSIDHLALSFSPDGTRAGVAEDRKSRDRFGRLRNARVDDNGIVADLEYLEKHPMAPQILEAAERMPELFALSHHADIEATMESGEPVVARILRVRGVDIIGTEPGTTTTLFESEIQMTKPADAATAVENTAVMDDTTVEDHGPPHDEDVVEQDGVVADDALEEDEESVENLEPPVDATPEDAVKGGFKAAIMQVLDEEGDEEAMAAKLTALLAAMSSAKDALKGESGGDDSGSDDSDTAESATDTKPEEGSSQVVESLQAEVDSLKKREKARETLESKGLKQTKSRVTALALIDDEEVVTGLIEGWVSEDAKAETVQEDGPGTSTPRSRPKVTTEESKKTEEVNDPTPKQAIETLRHGRVILKPSVN